MCKYCELIHKEENGYGFQRRYGESKVVGITDDGLPIAFVYIDVVIQENGLRTPPRICMEDKDPEHGFWDGIEDIYFCPYCGRRIWNKKTKSYIEKRRNNEKI